MPISDTIIYDNFFSLEFHKISQVIKDQQDAQIISEELNLTILLLEKLFNTYKLRVKYFSKKADEFINCFINSNDINDIAKLDEQFLQVINTENLLDIHSISELNEYIEQNELQLVISACLEDDALLRMLLTYKFYFGNRISFLIITTTEKLKIESKVYLTFSEQFKKELFADNVINLSPKDESAEALFTNLRTDLQSIRDELFHLKELVAHKSPHIENEAPIQNTAVEAFKYDAPVIVLDKEHPGPVDAAKPEQLTVDLPEIYDLSTPQTVQEKNYAAFQDKSFNDIREETAQISSPKTSTLKEPILTPREKEIYKELKRKKFISRLHLAEIAVGRQAAPSMKADAIDQIISRLRRKFVQAGFAKNYIAVRKGQGVVINE